MPAGTANRLLMFQSTPRPIRRQTEAARRIGTLRIASRLSGESTEKDFIGPAVLSTIPFPEKEEVSNRKGIFDE